MLPFVYMMIFQVLTSCIGKGREEQKRKCGVEKNGGIECQLFSTILLSSTFLFSSPFPSQKVRGGHAVEKSQQVGTPC